MWIEAFRRFLRTLQIRSSYMDHMNIPHHFDFDGFFSNKGEEYQFADFLVKERAESDFPDRSLVTRSLQSASRASKEHRCSDRQTAREQPGRQIFTGGDRESALVFVHNDGQN
eukprot:TRINITY_DN5069_c0_g2_i1.p1 TRINITY_DN5069_c0_g2~~TRINITY_DN5069_c0_g2_i1.p1  ORF type:complete len:113 (-),score=17.45 TRINITY_DN5069_c0_g2_i1:144-482(-)